MIDPIMCKSCQVVIENNNSSCWECGCNYCDACESYCGISDETRCLACANGQETCCKHCYPGNEDEPEEYEYRDDSCELSVKERNVRGY